MGRYTVVQARRACEDSMLGRRDTIEGCCQMLLKFPIDPATSKASLYTSVAQVCRGHCQLKRTITKHRVAQYAPEVAAVVVDKTQDNLAQLACRSTCSSVTRKSLGGQNIRLKQLATETCAQLAILSPTQELVESTIAGVHKTSCMLMPFARCLKRHAQVRVLAYTRQQSLEA